MQTKQTTKFRTVKNNTNYESPAAPEQPPASHNNYRIHERALAKGKNKRTGNGP